MLDAELSVSTRPAALTAATSVESTGLAEAAVATGAVDMPVKLPAPVLGTDEQAGPKSALIAAPDPPAADAVGDPMAEDPEAAGVEDDPEAAVDEPLELQAAVVSARPATMPVAARTLSFMVLLLR
jgi:hypothetical protein